VRDAHDRYANQEVAYLLQRVENFEGLVILASNFRNNIDDAFLRRFQAVVHFPKPSADDRLRIWRKIVPDDVSLEDHVNLALLFQRHELTGANVANIVHFACLQAISRGEKVLRFTDIQLAIDREYRKEGRLA
jgi:SpoVK/Ycf46/Vps4 family AAA+-type ATPase